MHKIIFIPSQISTKIFSKQNYWLILSGDLKAYHKCKLIVTWEPISGLTVWLVPLWNKEKQVIKILKKYYTSIRFNSTMRDYSHKIGIDLSG